MNCEDVRARFLEASGAALAGRGESAVARHLRSCAACGALAARILEETDRLASELEQLEPRMSEGDAVRIARAGRAAADGRAVVDRGPSVRRGAGTGALGPDLRRRWARWAPVPVAAAAAIAALVLTAGPHGPRREGAGPLTPSADGGPEVAVAVETHPELSVDIPEQGRVAVFQTSNPSITVVWFY